MSLLNKARHLPAQIQPISVGFPFSCAPGESTAILLNGGLVVRFVFFTYAIETELAAGSQEK